MKKTINSFLIVTSLFTVLSLPALSAPKLEMKLQPMKMKNDKVEMIKQSEKVNPGEVILYTLQVTNTGDEDALNVKADGNIPTNTTFIPKSTTPGLKVLFSIDGGETFQEKPTMKIKENGKDVVKAAPVEMYNKIRWVLNKVPEGKTVSLTYKVKIK